MNKIFTLTILVFLIVSCNKEQLDVPEPILASTVTFMFQNVVDGKTIDFDGTVYTNESGQDYTINAWKYFVSNVGFYNNGVLVFKEKDSYHYINQSEESTLSFDVLGVPEGSYDEIRYSFGIDEENNNGTATGGDIDPSTGMFWPMGGYRFSNFDGSNSGSGLAFHVGGNSNYVPLVFDSGIILEVKGGKNTLVHSMVNINQMFKSPNQIDFTVSSSLASEESTKILAENIANGMFMIHHIENPE